MPRRVFYSFAYAQDNWRVSQVRNIGVVRGNKPARDNDWESVKKRGDRAIQQWVDQQLKGRGCTVVLIGENTAGRKWIDYEIEKSWRDGKGLLGINIHGLKNASGHTSEKGRNPFEGIAVCRGEVDLSDVVSVYNPWGIFSTPYQVIESNIEDWIEEAIQIRNEHRC